MTVHGRVRGPHPTHWVPDSFFIVLGVAWLLLAVFAWNNRPVALAPALVEDALARVPDPVAGEPYTKHAGRRWQVDVPVQRPGIPRGTWVYFYRPRDGRFLEAQFIAGDTIAFERVLWFGSLLGWAAATAFIAARLRRRAEPAELRTVAPRVGPATRRAAAPDDPAP